MLATRTASRLCKLTRALKVPLSRNSHALASNRFLKVSEEVRDAVATGRPVVALESTIYTHGFPYPESVALARLLESLVRSHGGVPATIGVLSGVARVGLSPDELVELASTAEKSTALKASRRDLGYICGLGMAGRHLHGGTTVSGTMILAHLAGIKVFGTGGLGGVHRGGEASMDISGDLTELGRTPVAVVSSGCKSFLDIPRTLEYLETEGVAVGTFADGRQGHVDFPAFFTRDSGIKSPRVITSEAEAAAIVYAQSQIPVKSGIHFANPVPEEYSIPKAEMDTIIEEALRLADVEGHSGSDNTPFVLSKIKQLSGSKSVTANRALIESNVTRATKMAVELARLESTGDGHTRHMPGAASTVSTVGTRREPKTDILVAGSLAIDLSCDYAPFANESTKIAPVPHTSNPAVIGQSLGGVGHNVVVACKYLGGSTLFCSAVGDDLSGRAALAALQAEGLSTKGVQILPSARTAQYVAVNDAKKDLLVAMADMGIMESSSSTLNFDNVWTPLLQQTQPRWVVIDANWSPEVLSKWTTLAKQNNARVAFEPVSTAKSSRLFSAPGDSAISHTSTVPNNAISLAAPNKLELSTMHASAREAGLFDSQPWWSVIDNMGMPPSGSRDRLVKLTSRALVDEGIPQQSIQLLPFIPCILAKLGARGVLLTQLLQRDDPRLFEDDAAPYLLVRAPSGSGIGGVYMRLFEPAAVLRQEDVVSVNGAGDTLLGAVVTGLARDGAKGRVEEIVPLAQEASVLTLKSRGGVSAEIGGLERLLR